MRKCERWNFNCSAAYLGGVLRDIRAYGRHLRDSSTVGEDEVYEQQRHIAVTLILVVVMFIVCWTPLVVYAIYTTMVRDEERIHHLANPVVRLCTFTVYAQDEGKKVLVHYLLSTQLWRAEPEEGPPVTLGRGGGLTHAQGPHVA